MKYKSTYCGGKNSNLENIRNFQNFIVIFFYNFFALIKKLRKRFSSTLQNLKLITRHLAINLKKTVEGMLM